MPTYLKKVYAWISLFVNVKCSENVYLGLAYSFLGLSGLMPILGCPVPVSVRTNEQTYRETYRETGTEMYRYRCFWVPCARLSPDQ